MNRPFAAPIIVVGLFGGSVLAADMPVKAPVAQTQIVSASYDWSGLYVGANFGGAWSSGSLNITGNNFYGGVTEFIGGVQVGYNWQAGHFLFGVEGDFDVATFDHPTLANPTLGSLSQSWIGTAAGRFGIVDDRWLLYGKLGGGWVQSDATLNAPGLTWTGSSTKSGWLFGGGIEYGFKPNWTVRLDYDYLALGGWNSGTPTAIALSHDVQTVTAGISYKFGSGASSATGPSNSDRSEPSEDLAKQSQNPIADLISLPFQSNTNFNAGPFGRTQEILNIQPVVPMHLTADWNLISRTIVPVVSQPNSMFDGNTIGIGDITQSLFFSPVHSGELIWGAGPVFTIPSATDPILGTGRVLLGPTIVMLVTPGRWVIGALANNQWSVDGNPLRPSVNTFLAQPFINYNLPHGWFLTTAPIITANWFAPPGQQWTVPIGGGIGRVFKIEDQPFSASIAGYHNAISPTGAPNWQLRASFALLFPVK